MCRPVRHDGPSRYVEEGGRKAYCGAGIVPRGPLRAGTIPWIGQARHVAVLITVWLAPLPSVRTGHRRLFHFALLLACNRGTRAAVRPARPHTALISQRASDDNAPRNPAVGLVLIEAFAGRLATLLGVAARRDAAARSAFPVFAATAAALGAGAVGGAAGRAGLAVGDAAEAAFAAAAAALRAGAVVVALLRAGNPRRRAALALAAFAVAAGGAGAVARARGRAGPARSAAAPVLAALAGAVVAGLAALTVLAAGELVGTRLAAAFVVAAAVALLGAGGLVANAVAQLAPLADLALVVLVALAAAAGAAVGFPRVLAGDVGAALPAAAAAVLLAAVGLGLVGLPAVGDAGADASVLFAVAGAAPRIAEAPFPQLAAGALEISARLGAAPLGVGAGLAEAPAVGGGVPLTDSREETGRGDGAQAAQRGAAGAGGQH